MVVIILVVESVTFMEAYANEVIALIFSLYALPAQYNF